MQRLLYVSESCIYKSDEQEIVSKIVLHAQTKNAELSLTGALLFTGQHFAQIFEGPSESIQMLMASIYNDSRHRNVKVVNTTPIISRQFPDWQMAYQGPSQFVSRHVAKLLHTSSPSEQRRASEWLTELALEFSTT